MKKGTKGFCACTWEQGGKAGKEAAERRIGKALVGVDCPAVQEGRPTHPPPSIPYMPYPHTARPVSVAVPFKC